MSEFSSDWLALREPADHRSRNREVLAELGRAVGSRERVTIADLGAGTGSNLRALAPHLPLRQRWTLVDRDAGLLTAARLRLAAFGDVATETGDGYSLVIGERAISVDFREADLAHGWEAAIGPAADLVTAAALFDLVSVAAIESFADTVVKRKAAFYTALTYDGRDEWTPPHPADAAIEAAFHGHQRRDKGFGPAAGPDAASALVSAFRSRGYRVTAGDSAWRLGRADDPLIQALANGVAQAVFETGEMPPEAIGEWRKAQRDATGCLVGHQDILALPPG